MHSHAWLSKLGSLMLVIKPSPLPWHCSVMERVSWTNLSPTLLEDIYRGQQGVAQPHIWCPFTWTTASHLHIEFPAADKNCSVHTSVFYILLFQKLFHSHNVIPFQLLWETCRMYFQGKMLHFGVKALLGYEPGTRSPFKYSECSCLNSIFLVNV